MATTTDRREGSIKELRHTKKDNRHTTTAPDHYNLSQEKSVSGLGLVTGKKDNMYIVNNRM